MISSKLLLISILIIILLIYLYNKYTVRENFYSRTETMIGNGRKLKRNVRKNIENFKSNIVYKIKSSLRKAHF